MPSAMPSDPDLKRLAWRAHHRGTKEADLLIGGFFDAHHASWDADERALFADMLEGAGRRHHGLGARHRPIRPSALPVR